MDINIDYFDQLWTKRENKFKSYKEGSSKQWDSRVEEFAADRPDERINKITEILLDMKLLDETSSVLDLGCGPGKFALEFARTAKTVVGVDSAPKMLEAAEKNLRSAGLANTRFVELDWRQADLTALKWNRSFSLVTAIMSPAVSDKSSLDKMMAASNRYCFLSHFLERRNSVGDELKSRILGDYPSDAYGNKGLYCSFNILWLYRLFPEIVYFDTEREIVRPVQEAVRHYIERFGQKAALTEAQKEQIFIFLSDQARNGLVTERIRARIGCIFWQNR
jgi:SAM-dependent methyltransferase